MAHQAKRGPRPLILKCERREWKKERGIPLRCGPTNKPASGLTRMFLDALTNWAGA